MGERNFPPDFHQRVSLYFDNELDKKDQDAILDEVNKDKKCASIFEKEKSFRDFIKSNVKRPEVSADFVQNIRNQIRTK